MLQFVFLLDRAHFLDETLLQLVLLEAALVQAGAWILSAGGAPVDLAIVATQWPEGGCRRSHLDSRHIMI